MRKLWGTTAAILGTASALAATANANGPSVAQVLALKPVQGNFIYDTPDKNNWDKCKLEVLKTPRSGWTLRDHRGLVVRQFLDTNNDNVVDRWSFFMNGQEVYRDIDTNFNGKADSHHWFYTAGCRHGIDANEDGRIDEWKKISAEEASAEAMAAVIDRNVDRLSKVLLTDDDCQALGLTPEAMARVKESRRQMGAKFQGLTSTIPTDTQFSRFDGHSPMAVPAEVIGSTGDVVLYQNATIIGDTKGKTQWLRVSEVVKVGETWKLTDVPAVIDPNKASDLAGVLIPVMSEKAIVAATSSDDPDSGNSRIEDGEELQKIAVELQQHDQTMPQDASDSRRMVAYHLKRAELCARIGAKSKQQSNREYWYKQTADSLNAAVQTGDYTQGIKTLQQYADQFAKTSWGAGLAAYYNYRAINSEYAMALNDPKNDHVKSQEKYLDDLQAFLKAYPQAEDAPDALLQLGNGFEFANKEDQAIAFYKQLITQYPRSRPVAKATGSLRRLESVGQQIQLVGQSLSGGSPVDTTRYRGKVLVINYWATWCEPCKAEMPRLQKLREKYGKAGFEVIGVCLDAQKEVGQKYMRSVGYDWPQMYEEGSMESEPATRLGIISLPYLMMIDADGRVISKNVEYGNLEAEVEKAMARRVAGRND